MRIYFYFFISCLCYACQQKEVTPPYNIIYITLEDLSPYLGCYGDTLVQSPNIDAFAREALRFEDAHCQVALCTPSRTSILTGIRPSTSDIVKIDDDWQAMLPDAVSLPRHFKDNGYYTHALGKISDPRNGGMDDAWHIKEEEWSIKDNALIPATLETIKAQDQLFFLAIGYGQTHDPWHPTEQHLAKYDTARIELLGDGMIYKKEEKSATEIKDILHRYYASITEVDSLVGDLLAQLRAADLLDNSIIILGVLDHGYSLGLHNKWGKGDNYDNETQVPLFIRVPNHDSQGKRTPALVELVDIYPTLLDYCNLPNPTQTLEGHSLREWIEVSSSSGKPTIFTHRAYHVQEVAIKTKAYNLLTKDGIPIQLFDRINDPNNLTDILKDRPEVVKELMESAELD
ncbi:MAG: sulfatase-like hydrolase/transferase [Bacteroidota bacterium]